FGPYESYDSRSSLGGRDLYRSGYGFNEPEQSRFGGSYGGRFESSYRNSLDSFGESAVYLEECMVNKFKKASIRKQQTLNHPEAYKIIEKDVMEGVTADDHMVKVETVHCGACSMYIPAFHSSVQQHLKSPDHVKGKQAYKEQIKRESVLTATSILNNPIVKARYERFVKGENPFEVQDHSQDQQIEGDEEDEEKIDEPVEEEDEEEEEGEEEEEEEDEVEEGVETEEVEEEEEEEGGEAGVEGEGDVEGEEGTAESGDDENVEEAETEEEEGKEESASCPAEQVLHSSQQRAAEPYFSKRKPSQIHTCRCPCLPCHA
ncbi:hypothetical protein A6R68_02994, partial [Neotoma lepida]